MHQCEQVDLLLFGMALLGNSKSTSYLKYKILLHYITMHAYKMWLPEKKKNTLNV